MNNEIPDELKLDISIDIVNGMIYLHEHNIVHRDLKAANVLIEKYKFTAKICDLGQSVIPLNIKNSIQFSNNLQGTLTHMAPEVLSYKYCLASDVYSFGGVLFEIITHEYPWIYDLEEDANPNDLKFLISVK
jgi:serine/threonine protein kinase